MHTIPRSLWVHLSPLTLVPHPRSPPKPTQKPDNIGFDVNGNVKIFDFGFARDINTLDKKDQAGTIRYMAPECIMYKGTTLASDVYSFAVLLWQICTLKVPYSLYKSELAFTIKVVGDGIRPSRKFIYSKTLRGLLSHCWDSNPTRRPNFTIVRKVLESTVAHEDIKKNQKKKQFTRSLPKRTRSMQDRFTRSSLKRSLSSQSMLLYKPNSSNSEISIVSVTEDESTFFEVATTAALAVADEEN